MCEVVQVRKTAAKSLLFPFLFFAGQARKKYLWHESDSMLTDAKKRGSIIH